MNHCRKFILLWIAMVVGLTLSCRKGMDPKIEWIRTYGGEKEDRAFSVKQTQDEGYIIVGSTTSFGESNHKVYLIRTDADGCTLWTKRYAEGIQAYGYSVRQTEDGGYIVLAEVQPRAHTYLIKTNAMGEIIWKKIYGEGGGTCLQLTNDGGYVIKSSRRLIKTDTEGNVQWSKPYNGYFVHETSDGGYIITGHYPEYFVGGQTDIIIAKTDSNGDTIWVKKYGGEHGDTGYSVLETKDGGYMVLCQTATSGTWEDVCLLKVDENGDSLWAKVYGGERGDEGYSFTEVSNGGYIIAGYTGSYGAGGDDVYLIRTDEVGDTIWTFTYGGKSFDGSFAVENTSDGGYIIVGYTRSFGNGKSDVLLIKLKPE